MFPEQDKFYQELPFTLPPEQAKPPYIILGTGLQECLLAAYYAKMHSKPGLILDIDKTYGGCLKTVTLKQLHSLSTLQQQQRMYSFIKSTKFQQSNQQFFDKCIQQKAFRGYNIDIEPNYFFADSVTCQLLREADMDKYMDFRLVYRMLHYDPNSSQSKLKNVPLSKGKIFESKTLSLIEKKSLLSSFHCLAQIYHRYKDICEDQNSTKQFDKGFGKVDEKLYQEFLERKEELFEEFLKKITKNNKKIMEYMIYIICNYQYSYENLEKLPKFIQSEYTLAKFIERFGKFLKSCGVYGESPYLYVDNGIGDVPQSFSRIASIFGSTYILHPKITISKIEENKEDNKIRVYTNLYPDNYIETDSVYFGPTFHQNYSVGNTHLKYESEHILRVIVLFSKEEADQQKQFPSIAYLLNFKELFSNPIYLFMFDETSHTCPKQYLLYQFETVLLPEEKTNCEEVETKIEQMINILEQIQPRISERIKYVSGYIREKVHLNEDAISSKNQYILKDHNGIDLDSHFLNFKQVVGDQPRYFRKQNANTEEGEQSHGQDYETMGLIERLDQIQINEAKQNLNKVEETPNNQDFQPQQKQE